MSVNFLFGVICSRRASACFLAALLQVVFTSASWSQPAVLNTDLESLVPKSVQEAISAKLYNARPDLEVSNFRPSPMGGLYKINLNGQLAFVSDDGDFLIAGEMYKVNPGHLINLQEQERMKKEMEFAPKRAGMLSAVDQKDLVIYRPEKEVKGHIYVFTDIDCPFCRKFHSQLEEMLDKGIEVRYLAFPRAGINSRSAQKLATVWCADDRESMMTRYKDGENVNLATCEVTPVADHYMLGQDVGIRGTPAVILESGQLIPGAVSADMLAQEMGI